MWDGARRAACLVGLAAVGLVAPSACSSKAGYALSVDVRTDLAPRAEFAGVVTTVDDGAPVAHPASEAARDYTAGARVADFTDLQADHVRVRVVLTDADGVAVVERVSRVALAADYALTVVVTRSCAGVVCPLPDGDPAATTCAAGHCAEPECTPDTPTSCPAPDCAADADCRTENDCLVPQCVGGVCLFPPNDGLCAKGSTCSPTDGCVSPDGPAPCAKRSATEEACGDGVDDDCDGRVDCVDPDCDGRVCEDGDACTTGETCGASTCKGGAPVACDDGSPCTEDACDPKTGCTHAPRAGSCEDGDACTVGDACEDGACKPGAPAACDDQNPCTDDVCDALAGCLHPPASGPCDDGDVCTVGDACAGGVCKPGAPLACDDQNPCTADACDPKAGCGHAPKDGPCDDGVFCNGADTCANGACAVHAGTPCKQQCDEGAKSCASCLVDGDCGGPVATDFGPCAGFADACATDGTTTRTVTTFACKAGQCVGTAAPEVKACTRSTENTPCGDVVLGALGACGGFASTCDTTGTQSRDVTTPTCKKGACTAVVTKESVACTRPTDGTTCAATAYGAWGACGSFSSACDTTGTQSRAVTTYTCSGGACAATQSTATQSCTRAVAAGTSCGGTSYCCGGSCVSKSSKSHCGSCGVVCSGSYTCGQPVAGQYGCHCIANEDCTPMGYGPSASCWDTGNGGFCQCQCPGGATSCGGLCAGGATCFDIPGQNYCAY